MLYLFGALDADGEITSVVSRCKQDLGTESSAPHGLRMYLIVYLIVYRHSYPLAFVPRVPSVRTNIFPYSTLLHSTRRARV